MAILGYGLYLGHVDIEHHCFLRSMSARSGERSDEAHTGVRIKTLDEILQEKNSERAKAQLSENAPHGSSPGVTRSSAEARFHVDRSARPQSERASNDSRSYGRSDSRDQRSSSQQEYHRQRDSREPRSGDSRSQCSSQEPRLDSSHSAHSSDVRKAHLDAGSLSKRSPTDKVCGDQTYSCLKKINRL